MKSFRFCAALLLGALLIPVALPAVAPLSMSIARADDATDAATATLKEIYLKHDAALKSKDFDAVTAYEAPTYSEVDAKGTTRTKAEADARLKEQIGQLPADFDSVTTTVDSVTIGDDGMTAETSLVAELTISDPNGGSHKLVVSNKSTDVWVKNADAKDGEPAMLLVKSTEKETKVTLDGQEIPADG